MERIPNKRGENEVKTRDKMEIYRFFVDKEFQAIRVSERMFFIDEIIKLPLL